MSGPDFRELVGEDLPDEERTRLERVHELLLEAGPPPELPPSLAGTPGERTARVTYLPRRRLGTAIILAAALTAAAFGGGYLLGHSREGFKVEKPVAMHGTAAAPGATALLQLAARDDSGNWPLRMVVHGLPELPSGGYYELYLTRNHKPAATCGTFAVESGKTTVVRLNAPYRLKSFDGWVVTEHIPGRPPAESPVLLTT